MASQSALDKYRRERYNEMVHVMTETTQLRSPKLLFDSLTVSKDNSGVSHGLRALRDFLRSQMTGSKCTWLARSVYVEGEDLMEK